MIPRLAVDSRRTASVTKRDDFFPPVTTFVCYSRVKFFDEEQKGAKNCNSKLRFSEKLQFSWKNRYKMRDILRAAHHRGGPKESENEERRCGALLDYKRGILTLDLASEPDTRAHATPWLQQEPLTRSLRKNLNTLARPGQVSVGLNWAGFRSPAIEPTFRRRRRRAAR